MTNSQIKALVALVFLILVVVLAIQGQAPSKEWLHSFSWVVTGVSLSLLLWERWLWSWWGFGFLAKRPDLRGTWRGSILSDWEDPTTKQRRDPVEIYFVIRQTFSTLDIRLFSPESASQSLSAEIVTDSVGLHTIALTYLNTPDALRLEQSPISHGGAILGIRGNHLIRQLDGKYWTDRKTVGQMLLTARSSSYCHDFSQAREKFLGD